MVEHDGGSDLLQAVSFQSRSHGFWGIGCLLAMRACMRKKEDTGQREKPNLKVGWNLNQLGAMINCQWPLSSPICGPEFLLFTHS